MGDYSAGFRLRLKNRHWVSYHIWRCLDKAAGSTAGRNMVWSALTRLVIVEIERLPEFGPGANVGGQQSWGGGWGCGPASVTHVPADEASGGDTLSHVMGA